MKGVESERPKWGEVSGRFISVAILLAVSLISLAPRALGKDWERLDKCQFVPMSFNDGDSFLVRQNGREIVVRLYSVDCGETSNLFPERVKEQADYFGVSRERAMELGEAATSFVARRLAGLGEEGFTIFTRWEDGWGQKKRYLVVIPIGDKTLAEILTEQGLARIHGLKNPGDWPGGMNSETLQDRLRSAEQRAKAARAGGWGDASADSIAAAGGEESEAEAVAKLNRENSESGKPLSDRLNINEGTLEELDGLPGIGKTLAGRIVAERPFWSVADLRHIEGIGDVTVATLSPLVTVVNLNAPRGTADHLRLEPERFRHREVQVFITALEEINLPAPDGFAVMRARTARDGELGGAIEIFFPEEQREQVLNYFSKEQAGQTRAVFYNFQGEDVLVVPRRAVANGGSQ
jgi:DNA uptake protein ComE-like DNA-binding protein